MAFIFRETSFPKSGFPHKNHDSPKGRSIDSFTVDLACFLDSRIVAGIRRQPERVAGFRGRLKLPYCPVARRVSPPSGERVWLRRGVVRAWWFRFLVQWI